MYAGLFRSHCTNIDNIMMCFLCGRFLLLWGYVMGPKVHIFHREMLSSVAVVAAFHNSWIVAGRLCFSYKISICKAFLMSQFHAWLQSDAF